MRILILALLFCGLASTASAQAITSWTVNLYTGLEGSSLLRTTTVPASAVTCGVDPASVQPEKSARWDDPVIAGRKCQWVDTVFFTLAPGNYQGGLRASNSAGLGPEGTRFPFSVAAPPVLPPAAPTGLSIKP